MNGQSFPYAFFEGNIIPTKEAKISIMANALQYGTGVFGGIRGYLSKYGKTVNIFRINDHYERLLNALKILKKEIKYSKDDLVSKTLELVKKNAPSEDFYLRPFCYAKNYVISPDLSKLEFDFAIYMVPMGEYLSINKGLKLQISNWVRINDNMIPSRAKITGGYINSSLAKGDAVDLGFDDALMLTQDGHVAEGSGANFFMVRDGILITSPKYDDILEGITRRTILELAHDMSIPVEERSIDRTELFIADEAFLAGTGAQIAWISEIDRRKIGKGTIGPLTQKIQKLFFDIVRGSKKEYSFWLTSV